MSNTNPTNTSAFPASYKTPAVVLIYAVKYGNSLGSDRVM